jgi:hypothetical protein
VEESEETGLNCTLGEVSSKGTIFCAPYGDTGWQILWFTESESSEDGELFTLSLRVSEDAVDGTYSIKVSYSPANTVTNKDVEASTDAVDVAFAGGNGILRGDVNSDGRITTVDVVRIARYLIDDISLMKKELTAADVTGDGKVTAADVIRLMRYLIGLAEISDV